MNMKVEEQQEQKDSRHEARRKSRRTNRRAFEDEEDDESVISGEEAPSEYESILQKYEAEVRNHIKIEQ